MIQCRKCLRYLDESEFYTYKGQIQYPCKECKKSYQIRYNLEHQEQRQQYMHEYHRVPEIKVKRRNYNRIRYQKVKENQKEYYKIYNSKEENKEKRRLDWYLNGLNRNLAKGVSSSLKFQRPKSWCYSVLKFTYKELKQHLENQFTPEMNWNNYGSYWEIDHIIPLSTFNFTSYDDKEFKICWSLINLRPLEKSLNRQRPKDGSDISEEVKQKILNQNL